MNNSYRKAYCKIKKYNENRLNSNICSIVGPTGPAGMGSITIGNTTTGNPGTNAVVTNTGTSQDAILNFTIPRGATGPAGPVGPAGPQGPAGISATNTYGRKYDTTETPITLVQNVASDVPLMTNGPANLITQGTTNKLTIPATGIYKIDYYFSGSSNAATELTLNVKQNDNSLDSTTISKNVTQNQNTDFTGSTILNLTENDQIGLALQATDAATITPESGTSAYINIVRIA